jgi:acetyl esterase/lipase
MTVYRVGVAVSRSNKPDDAGGPTLSGVVGALRALATPAGFDAPKPTWAKVRYRPERFRRRPPLADVYVPAHAEHPRSSVVIVHGGAFTIGSRTMKPVLYLTRRLLDAGHTVMTFDYRLILRGGRIEEQVDDVTQALLFWMDQRKRFDLEPSRRAIVGLSAGATLALLAIERLPPRAYSRFVAAYGVYDFTTLSGPLSEVSNRLLFRTDDIAKKARWSPLHVSTSHTPMTLLHGTRDGIVPFEQAERFYFARKAANLPVELRRYEGAEHAFFNEAGAPETISATRHLLEALRVGSIDGSKVRAGDP